MSWNARGRYALVLASMTVLQLGLFSDLRIGGVHPDITLLVAVGTLVLTVPARGGLVLAPE